MKNKYLIYIVCVLFMNYICTLNFFRND
jgi:hypothetical protein